MDIRVRLECVFSLQDGEVNINEVLHVVGKASWLPHDGRGAKGQLCLCGGFRSAGIENGGRCVLS